jgi:hypothetical protein
MKVVFVVVPGRVAESIAERDFLRGRGAKRRENRGQLQSIPRTATAASTSHDPHFRNVFPTLALRRRRGGQRRTIRMLSSRLPLLCSAVFSALVHAARLPDLAEQYVLSNSPSGILRRVTANPGLGWDIEAVVEQAEVSDGVKSAFVSCHRLS